MSQTLGLREDNEYTASQAFSCRSAVSSVYVRLCAHVSCLDGDENRASVFACLVLNLRVLAEGVVLRSRLLTEGLTGIFLTEQIRRHRPTVWTRSPRQLQPPLPAPPHVPQDPFSDVCTCLFMFIYLLQIGIREYGASFNDHYVSKPKRR